MSYLQEIVDATRRRVAEARTSVPEEVLEHKIKEAEPARAFGKSLEGADVSIIAEIKRASPFSGPLNLDLDAAEAAQSYARAGAAAISVLTEPTFFRGSLEDLVAAGSAGLPVLRKDFVLDAYQLQEARAAGAAAVLLIVRILEGELADLIKGTEALGMDALVEVHEKEELRLALDAGASVIGINHRNLETGEVHPKRTAELSPHVPPGITLVGLSGVSTRADVEALGRAGASAVLVGQSLVTAADPEAKLRELLGH